MSDPGSGIADEELFFGRYWASVGRLLGIGDPGLQSAANKLSGKAPATLDANLLVSSLCRSLDGPWWRAPQSRTTGNWVWRTGPSRHTTSSPEVRLERRIAELDLQGVWSFQMSTSSGYRGSRTDKRRAIDLVHRTAENSYRFIELKINSDNPLYAAFEILGYGLAYCLARHHGTQGSGSHNVMGATHVALEVLAPRSWYEYKERRGAPSKALDLSWLEAAINAGLSSEIRTLDLEGFQRMSFSFRSFSSGDDMDRAAAEIVGAAST